ncbi:hypothetical protein QBC32DRAFT_400361 [Pseudoneurospora amorphoporcata]|uniref:F-box domain-containing protein n=1 Tax=Pseudoneurospora amorphoporcata TaxID=241081 RepID=A0AAN6NNQ3_9PEZI|nr:hypothetical protein QBC32DRAFT_400361 [Pseudoneurospora amorphoporcata]
MEEPYSTLALPGLPTHSISPRLDNLCTEVLLLIFEELPPRDVVTVSRVCQRFNKITTPIIYHTVPLERLLDERHVKEILSRRQENAFSHTQQLLIGGGIKYGDIEDGDPTQKDTKPGDVKQDDIKRFLTNTKKLQSVKYAYSPGCGEKPICPWKQVHDMGIHLREGNARLSVDKFIPTDPINDTWKIRGIFPNAGISKSLVALKMGSVSVPHSESALQILKLLLLRTPLLETFHYIDCRAQRVPGQQFKFEEGQRLPPFKDLMLKNYDWKHDAEEVKLHWDFSRIRSLALLMIPVYKFLESVPFSDLTGLRHLHAEDYNEVIEHQNRQYATEYQNRQLATKNLHVLIKDHIKSLQTLNITCFIGYFHIDALLAHAESLTSLVLRDHDVSNNLQQHRPALSAENLTVLSRSMSSLETLEIDIDHTAFPEACLSALCQFPRLHTLVLHTKTVIQPNSNHRPGQDPDLTRAYDCFTTLVKQRRGPTKWQRVVINVGGWREREVTPRAGRRPRVGRRETYTYYRACVFQRYFVLEESAFGQEDLIYEELPPKDEGLTHFYGNLRTGKSLEPQSQVAEATR